MLYTLLLLVDGVTSRHFCTPTSHMGTVIVLLTNFTCEVKETVSSQEELQRRLLWCWERLSLWTHAHLRTHMRTHMYTYTTQTHTSTQTHTMHSHTHTHTHMHTYTCTHMHTSTHKHTCTYVHILHTHTHTHKVYESTSVLPFMNLPTVSLKREDSVCVCV